MLVHLHFFQPLKAYVGQTRFSNQGLYALNDQYVKSIIEHENITAIPFMEVKQNGPTPTPLNRTGLSRN